MTTTKRVVSVLNDIRKSLFDLYTYHETIFKLTEKYQPHIIVKMPRKYSKCRRSI